MNMVLCTKCSKEVVFLSNDNILNIVNDFLEPYICIKPISKLPSYKGWTVYATNRLDNNSVNSYQVIRKDNVEGNIYASLRQQKIIIEHIEDNQLAITAKRIIRGILRWSSFSSGTLFMHGGFVEVNGVGIMLLGERKSGKTSTIMSLLSHKGVKYGTNDDLSLNVYSNRIQAEGWGKSISVRNDTIMALSNTAYKYSMAKLENKYRFKLHRDNSTFMQDKSYFTPKFFSNIYNREMVKSLNIKAIIFPQFIGVNGQGSYINALSKYESLYYLKKNIEHIPEEYNSFLSNYFSHEDYSKLYKQISYVNDMVPSFTLKQYLYDLESGSEKIVSLVKEL